MPLAKETIEQFFRDFNDEGILERSLNAYKNERVCSLNYDGEFRYVSAVVKASMKAQTYNVQAWISAHLKIEKVECTCPRGKVVCHHIGAVLLFLHHRISKTDIECRWSAPKGYSTEGRKICDVFPPSDQEQEYNPFVMKPSKAKKPPKPASNLKLFDPETAVKEFKGKLYMYSEDKVGFQWILAPEPEPEPEALPPPTYNTSIEAKIYSNGFQITDLVISKDEIIEIESSTRGQGKNPRWFQERKFRLTASNFGKIIGAIRRNSYPPSFYKSLRGGYFFKGVKSIRHGKINETTAIQAFQNQTGLTVMSAGLMVHRNGILAASPDGFVVESGLVSLVEAKCPYKYREKTVEEMWRNEKESLFQYLTDAEFATFLQVKQNNEKNNKKTTKDFHLFETRDKNGSLYIDKFNDYYHQVQGQLYVCEKTQCYFLIWTQVDFVFRKIQRDDAWRINLQMLENFYREKFLPKLLDPTAV